MTYRSMNTTLPEPHRVDSGHRLWHIWAVAIFSILHPWATGLGEIHPSWVMLSPAVMVCLMGWDYNNRRLGLKCEKDAYIFVLHLISLVMYAASCALLVNVEYDPNRSAPRPYILHTSYRVETPRETFLVPPGTILVAPRTGIRSYVFTPLKCETPLVPHPCYPPPSAALETDTEYSMECSQ